MTITRLMIANRGEIAVRIARAARELGTTSVAIYSGDDARSLHLRRTDEAVELPGRGVAAYLDVDAIIDTAKTAGCDGIHPGYGFLAESQELAAAAEAAGMTFVGPSPETLSLFGDKGRARSAAEANGVPVVAGRSSASTLEEVRAFMAERPDKSVVVKAVAGGGGRGMRIVDDATELDDAYARARSEAAAAFGSGDLYVEELLSPARHIEIQIIGDGSGAVSHLFERECTIQRRNQKLIEIAPSPTLTAKVRDAIADAAVLLAAASDYRSLGTFEFLVDGDDHFAFIEANARLQVEHTVTEEVTGIDLVKAQLRLAGGATLDELGLAQDEIPAPRGFAVQARVNMETMMADGMVKPSGGTLSAFELPSGPGVRVDTYGYVGYTTNPSFDSLLAKVIASSAGGAYAEVLDRAYAALCEFKVEGVETNIPFLQALLRDPRVRSNDVSTRFVDHNVSELVEEVSHEKRFFEDARTGRGLAGAKIDAVDPLAVLDHGQIDDVPQSGQRPSPPPSEVQEGFAEVRAPLQGTILSIAVAEGQEIAAGAELLVMDAMKMEHVIAAPVSGVVTRIDVHSGDAVFEDHPLVMIEEGTVDIAVDGGAVEVDLDHVRPDLAEAIDRHEAGLDHRRDAAVARRHGRGHRTARENLADIVDEGTFVEYGPVVIAAQRRRRDMEDLIANTPGDGIVCGIGTVNGDLFDDDPQCMFMSYDYMVLAGTQGMKNHAKKDRMFEIAKDWQLPVVLFAEGGGGRPGDTDGSGVAGLDCLAFTYFARLSGLVPMVGVTNGRCFAGNAVLLSMCDVIIATEGSNIGIGGPAMIEGGGLGIFKPEEVGPMDVQVPNGVVDILVRDEQEACQVAKKYLSYFQGRLEDWECPDQRLLRSCIPENRLRVYDVRKVIETMADNDSVLELREQWGHGIITSLIRIEGRPVGVVANNPAHLSGAIDSDGADKGARFMQLCDAFDIPVLMLCDCPGIMVGPEIEKEALVRHAGRMFVVGASMTVPFFTIVLRKGYGLGAQAMAGGSFKTPLFTVTWPTGEFGGMGLEGAVKLGYRKELAAIEDPKERKAEYELRVEQMYENGKAVNMASHFELDDVIDPKDSRQWITTALKAAPRPGPRSGKKRPCVDTW